MYRCLFVCIHRCACATSIEAVGLELQVLGSSLMWFWDYNSGSHDSSKRSLSRLSLSSAMIARMHPEPLLLYLGVNPRLCEH